MWLVSKQREEERRDVHVLDKRSNKDTTRWGKLYNTDVPLRSGGYMWEGRGGAGGAGEGQGREWE